jgi:hypothetical protein
MEIKVGDKFIRVWDEDYPVGIVTVTHLNNRLTFVAKDCVGDYWSYEVYDLKAYGLGNDVISILAPLNNLTTLLYLGENNG